MNRPVTLLVKSGRPGWTAKALIVTTLALLLGAWLPGCGTSQQEEPRASSDGDHAATRGVYVAKTDGSAAELAEHLGRLEHQYTEINESSPTSARAALLAYTDAMAKTSAALLDREGISPDLRNAAAATWLTNLKRRLDPRPEDLDRFLAAANAIQERFPNTPAATLAAFLTIETVGKEGDRLGLSPEERFEAASGAAIVLGEADPPHPEAPKILAQLAPAAEQLGHPDRALVLYQLLAKHFGDQPEALFALGNAHRLGLVGQPVKNFEGRSLDGELISLDQFRGKVVLIDFWATWCAPCMQELPTLQALQKQLANDGFVLLGVSLDRDLKTLRKQLESQPSSGPQIAVAESPAFLGWRDGDPGKPPETSEEIPAAGEALSDLEARFGISLIPMKMLIDREGKLVATNYSAESLLPELQKLFPGKELAIPSPETNPTGVVSSPVPAKPPEKPE